MDQPTMSADAVLEAERRIEELEAALAAERDRAAALESKLSDSQERFRQVTDTIDQVFWMTDPSKEQQLFISKAYETVWGRSLRSLRDDPTTFLVAIHPDDRQRVIDALPLQVEGKYDIEYRVIGRSDGCTRWVRDRAFPVRDATGRIYRVVGTATDVTEQKRLMQELTAERDRAETLLQNILPASIIDELQRRGRQGDARQILGKRIEHASVLFADIVGFTAMAARHDAGRVVTLLNDLFSVFDHLVGDFGLEKIKTIGDCYMLAGGVPDEQPGHERAVADVALEMLDQVRLFNERTGESLGIRIGIHAGPLLAGVIGVKKFVFDVWGDTVNIASRMESHGLPGRVHVTEDYFVRLRDEFVGEPRGEISVKGRGAISTYMLVSRAPRS